MNGDGVTVGWIPGERVAPATTTLACGGAVHRVLWEGGTVVALDHDAAAEAALVALGSDLPACLALRDLAARLGEPADGGAGPAASRAGHTLLATTDAAFQARVYATGLARRIARAEAGAKDDRDHLVQHIRWAATQAARAQLERAFDHPVTLAEAQLLVGEPDAAGRVEDGRAAVRLRVPLGWARLDALGLTALGPDLLLGPAGATSVLLARWVPSATGGYELTVIEAVLEPDGAGGWRVAP